MAGADVTFTREARALLCGLEGCRLEAYRDFGNGVWTIGYGHTGADVHQGVCWTKEQAEAALDDDVARFSLGVERMLQRKPLPVPLNDNQFSALVIFAFNVGLMALDGSTAFLRIRSGQLGEVPEQLARWNKVHDCSGVPILSPILTKRRAAEVRLWSTPMAAG